MKPVELFTKFADLVIAPSKSQETHIVQFDDITNQTITGLCICRHDLLELKEGRKQKPEKTITQLNTCLTAFNTASITINEDPTTSIMRIGLLSNSITYSLSRLVELLENDDKKAWKKESTTATIAECKKIQDALYQHYTALRSDDAASKHVEEKLEDLNKTLANLQKML
jgi:hypothetical protein